MPASLSIQRASNYMLESPLCSRVVVLGSRGQLGRELCRLLERRAIGLDRAALDITIRDQVVTQLPALWPSCVINAAAYTNVDLAEREPELCQCVNSRGVLHIVEACRIAKCALVQVSTDYVFGVDAQRLVPYVEEDHPGPLNTYGLSKWEGERHAAELAESYIVRTSGLYGAPPVSDKPQDFVDRLLHSSNRGGILRVVDDQRCTPSYVPDVATAILALIETEAYGTYHMTNQGSTTWHEFATETFKLSGIAVSIEAISSDAWLASAARPSYSVLNCAKYERLVQRSLPAWQEALSKHIRERRSLMRSADL